MTVNQAYRICLEATLQQHEASEATAMVNLLFEDLFGYSKIGLIAEGENEFVEAQKLIEACDRLKSGEPVQYIIGKVDFYGMKVNVNSSVLIPRPETEELAYWLFERETKRPKTAVDICTGSGCLALALRKKYSESSVFATDISESALKTARSSELEVFGNSKIHFIEQNILNQTWQREWPDIVVSNPPYIMREEGTAMSPSVINFEPEIALFADGEDPLVFYKRIIEVFSSDKMPSIYFELNPLTANDLKTYCKEKDLHIETGKDMSGKERFAKVGI